MKLGGCILSVVFCNVLCSLIWHRNRDEPGELRFVLQCALYPKDSDEPGGLHGVEDVLRPRYSMWTGMSWGGCVLGVMFCNALCTLIWHGNSDEAGRLHGVVDVSHSNLAWEQR